MYSISIIGSGNIAHQFSLALCKGGHKIDYIYNRTQEKGEKLIKFLGYNSFSAQYTSNIEDCFNSEILIIAISDNSIESMIEKISLSFKESPRTQFPLILHTSGASPLSIFSALNHYTTEYGVLYPLMTISKLRNIDFKDVPFLLEANSEKGKKTLIQIAESLHSEYNICDSQTRLANHAAAVFSCNFVNYILGLSFDIAKNNHTYLLPTTLEMVRKCFLYTPEQTLTGPALREDYSTINKHLELLEKMGLNEHKEIYEIITNNIIKHKKEKN